MGIVVHLAIKKGILHFPWHLLFSFYFIKIIISFRNSLS